MTTSAVFIGEAWGEKEAQYETAFVGPAGQELYRILHQAGWHKSPLAYNYVSPMTMFNRWSVFPHKLLNVFNERPEKNNVELFYGKRTDPVDFTLPVRKFGATNNYVLKSHAHHVYKLRDTLTALKPNLIVACGATACWSLGLGTNISNLRGFVHRTVYGKVLPVYHPAAILRNWSLRAPTLLDLVKARHESAYPEIQVPSREIWTEPTIADLWAWWEQHGKHSKLISFDIETLKKKLISEIGFASDPYHALHIPFVWQQGKEYKSWWPDAATEAEAWRFVKHVCESDIPKIGQNVIQYDCYWMTKQVNIVVKNVLHDTMVLSHCWQPELEKSLRFLGSIFLPDASWKSIRHDSNKQDD